MIAPDARTAGAALAAVDADWTEPAGPGPAELADYLRAHPVTGEGRCAAFQPGAAIRIRPWPQRLCGSPRPTRPRMSRTCRSSRAPRWPAGTAAQLTVWTATSTPFRARGELAAEFGIDQASVHVVVPDYGGGFGGKHGSAVALEAARLARAAGRPVKVQWSRADEFTRGYLRPAAIIDVASSARTRRAR